MEGMGNLNNEKRKIEVGNGNVLERVVSKNEIISDETIAKYLHLSLKEIRELKNTIGKKDGHVSFIIHPLYNYLHKGSLNTFGEEIDFSYVKKFFYKSLKLVTEREDSSPLFIFDVHSDVARTKRNILLHNWKLPKRNRAIFIPTYAASGIPHFSDEISAHNNSSRTNENFRILGNILFSLGIRSVVLSGMHFDQCLNDMRTGLEEKGFQLFFSRNIIGKGNGPLTAEARRNLDNIGPPHALF